MTLLVPDSPTGAVIRKRHQGLPFLFVSFSITRLSQADNWSKKSPLSFCARLLGDSVFTKPALQLASFPDNSSFGGRAKSKRGEGDEGILGTCSRLRAGSRLLVLRFASF